MFWYGSKNGCSKDTCLKDIRLHAQNLIIILGLVVKVILGGMYDHLTRVSISIITMNKMSISTIIRIVVSTPDLLTISYQSHDLYPRRSGLVGKTTILDPISLRI